MPRAFTYLDVIIILAIIGILAIIAMPNLVSSRQASNETMVTAALRNYSTAQIIFKSSNYSALVIGKEKNRWYAPDFARLGGRNAYEINQKPLTLLDANIADATQDLGYNGYFFTNDANIKNWDNDYGLYADPCSYGKIGIHTYYIGKNMTILFKDLNGTGAGQPIDNTWDSPE